MPTPTKISEIRVVFTDEMKTADVYAKIIGGTWHKKTSEEGRPLVLAMQAKNQPVVVTEWDEADPPTA